MVKRQKQITIRLSDKQFGMVKELANLAGTSQNQLLVGLIVGQYDKVRGNPELLKLLEQLNEFKKNIAALGGNS